MAAVVVLGFVAVSLGLVYWQVLRAPALAMRAGNPRALEAQRGIDRGTIVDRHGVVLASSVRTAKGFQRRYTLPSLSPVIGYSSVRYGQDGLEKAFNSQLTGTSGDLWTALANQVLERPQVGDRLTLSIDANLQRVADQAMGSASGAAILMKPQTGEVLAMVTRPYFDANKLATELPRLQHDASGALFNRATLGLFPPGSTYKIVTVSAGLSTGAVTPQTPYHEPNPTFLVDGFPVRGRNLPPGMTDVNLDQAFQYSCNLCFAQLGLKLGWPATQQYAARFGIGKPVPFDIPVRTSRLYDPGTRLSRVLLANTAYGQGQLVVTPLQMLLITAAIANGGQIPQPHLVMKETTPAGQTVAQWSGGTLGAAVDAGVAGQVK
ncbi:MAG: penicillin-binding transpeptidase domain-containing protein, partial [Chloroflexota bacterium]